MHLYALVFSPQKVVLGPQQAGPHRQHLLFPQVCKPALQQVTLRQPCKPKKHSLEKKSEAASPPCECKKHLTKF